MNTKDDAFLDWFAGFVAGEGSFITVRRSNRRHVSARLTIDLRDDDLDILLEIQERLGMGRIYRSSRENSSSCPIAYWQVYCIADCRRLVDIFDSHPLRAKKRRDYEVWREAVMELVKPAGLRDVRKLHYLGDKLKMVRHYDAPDELPDYGPDAIQLTLPETENETD